MLKLLFSLVGLLFRSHIGLLADNMALRHQLSVLQRTARRPRLKARDRVFWVWLSRIWPRWRSALLIVQPETVVKWHRQGFKLYWRWKSRKTRRDTTLAGLTTDSDRDQWRLRTDLTPVTPGC